jgi:hypothetical protein
VWLGEAERQILITFSSKETAIEFWERTAQWTNAIPGW